MLRSAFLVVLSLFSVRAQAAGVSIPASDPLLRYTGRFDFSTPAAPRFGWPGVMIEAAFSGTSVGIKLSEQVAYTSYFDASIDGAAPVRITSTSTVSFTHNITGLAAGSHTLRLVRRSESFNGATSGQEYSAFHGLDLDAGASLLALPAPPVRKIEIIGDSLSVGYGNEGPGLSCPGTVPQYTNNYLAYGSLVARTFCAEVHSTAISGHGLVSNYGDGISSPYPLPSLFNRTLPGSASPTYNFAAWQPDAVVIFLGTNDFSTGSTPPNGPSQAAYESAYNALIADLRSKYGPNPWIFCLHHTVWDGTGSFDFGPYVTNVVSYQTGTLGDPRVRGVDMDPYAGSACDYHPSLAEDQAMANRLRLAISAATGWVAGSCPSVGTPTFSPTVTRTRTVTLTPTPGTGTNKDYCVTLDRSAIPALVNDRKLTLKVDVGTCSSVAVTADGSPIASTYNAGTGEAMFTTTGSNLVVTAVNWTAGGTGAAAKAVLYDDKHWAQSVTFDDGLKSPLTNAKPLLDAKGWRAGAALTTNFLTGGTYMTTAEAQSLRAAGWDIFNHSQTHPNLTCANFTAELTNAETYFNSNFPGYNVSHLVFPYEDLTAMPCGGFPPAFLLSSQGGGTGYSFVDGTFTPAYRNIPRTGLYGTSASALLTLAANASANARPGWIIVITHSVSAGSGAPVDAYSTNAATLSAWWDALDTNYGSGGAQDMWFAPAGEVYDYLLVRDSVTVSTPSCGTPTFTPTPCAACSATATRTPSASPTATPSATPIPACSILLVDNAEDGNTAYTLGSWSTWGDPPATASAPDASGPGYPSSPYGALHAISYTGTNVLSGYVHVGSLTANFSAQQSLPPRDRLSFWIKATSASTSYGVQIVRAAITDYDHYATTFTAPAGVWTRFDLPLSGFAQGGWGAPVAMGWSDVTGVMFYATAAGAFSIAVDDLEFGCPSAPTPTSTLTPTRTLTPVPSSTSTRTLTFSPTLSATPTLTGTPSTTSTPSGTRTQTPTSSATPSASSSPSTTPSSTPLGTFTVTLTETPYAGSPTHTPSFTSTPTYSSTPSNSPSASPTGTATPSASATPTRSSTATATASPTGSATPTSSASITHSPTSTSTVSPTATRTRTATLSATPTGTATPSSTETPLATATATSAAGSATPSSTATPTATLTPTQTLTTSPSATATATPTPSSTETPLPAFTPTFTATHSFTSSPTPGAPAATSTPDPNGPLRVLDLKAWPNPNPAKLAIKLEGAAERVEVRVYSVAEACVAVVSSGPHPAGWSSLDLPAGWVARAANGYYFARAKAMQGSKASAWGPAGKITVLK